MSEAPEKIWATTGLYYDYVQDWSEGQWQDDAENAIGTGDDETVVEYIRSDLAQAMVAAAYEDAAQKASLGRTRGITASMEDIRSSTPTA